jgi:ubiquinone/menaquinone biosynthesis C-methylase UbiE
MPVDSKKREKYKREAGKFWSRFGDDWEKAKYLIWGETVTDEFWNEQSVKEHFNEFLNGIELLKDWTILDYGCGVGRTLKLVAPLVQFAIGVDISHDMIELSKKYLKGIKNVQTHEINGVDLSLFPDNKFNFVFEKGVFTHIPDTEITKNILREIARVLKPNGIARMNFNKSPSGLMRKIKHFIIYGKANGLNTTWNGQRCSFKGNHYSESQLRTLFSLSGLSISNLKSYDAHPAWWWTTSSPIK